MLAVHEFHVWQLAGNRIIASAHIRCHNLRDYMRIAEEVKSFFHNEGIHSTTIQPEFVEVGSSCFSLDILFSYVCKLRRTSSRCNCLTTKPTQCSSFGFNFFALVIK